MLVARDTFVPRRRCDAVTVRFPVGLGGRIHDLITIILLGQLATAQSNHQLSHRHPPTSNDKQIGRASYLTEITFLSRILSIAIIDVY